MANVVKDFDWTSIPKGSSLRNNAPRVIATSYRIASSQALNRLKGYLNVIQNIEAEQFYDQLYDAEQETRYVFPFLGDSVRSFSNEFGDSFQSSFLGAVDSALQGATRLQGEAATFKPIENASNFFSDIKQGVQNAGKSLASGEGVISTAKNLSKSFDSGVSTNPGSYIETPKLYQYSQNDAPLEVSFVLSNTINDGSYEKNAALVEELTRINRPERKSSLIVEPPRIYEVKLKGIRYMKWAYCSGFNVSLLGTRKEIGGKIIPEGYLVNMSFTSLTTEVSNFMDKI